MNTKWNQQRGQNFSATHLNFFEFPSEDPSQLEVYCYTDNISYAPGDTVQFHVSTTAKSYSIEVFRDGSNPESVYSAAGLEGQLHKTPVDAPMKGCGWPVSTSWLLPLDLRSGGYLVLTKVRGDDGEEVEHEHFFVVRSANPGRDTNILLVCATSTWIAYNDWGGANHYEGNQGNRDTNQMCPVLSTQRPWARGQVRLPIGAPRIPMESPPEKGAMPRYPNIEFAYTNGYSKYYAAAGWAMYERHFVSWAEDNGYTLDVATQHDLQFSPELVKKYKCIVFVGHDEYWSAEQRDAVDAYVDQGGNIARFGGNFIWQVRLENNGKTQVCYKYNAEEQDDLARSQPEKLTHAWDHAQINRPGTHTFGLSGANSVYVGLGGFNPRNAKGFTVYRPEHWIFEDSDLYFGDTFGSEARVFAYEVDSVDFTFRHGLPYPTYSDGAPDGLEIVAMGVSSNIEEDHGNHGTHLYAGEADWEFICDLKRGDQTEESRSETKYGAGMIGVFSRNGGTVVNAGSVEWVNGLRLREPMTEQITRNVLNKLSS